MEMKIWQSIITFLFAFIAFISGEEITIRTPTAVADSQGTCVFPDFLTIELLRPGPSTQWSIRLKQDNVLPLVPSVYLMVDSESRDMEEQRVVSEGHDGLKGFHNYTYGAAFTVKCARNSQGRQLFVLEGSVFLDQQKYRVTPASLWQQRAKVSPSFTTGVYMLEEATDFKAGSRVINLPSSEDNTQNDAPTQTASRHKRAVSLPATYTIDILAVIDYTLYNRFFNLSSRNATTTIAAIVDYLTNLFTAVSMRFDTLNLQNRTLKIRLVQPVLLTNASQAPYNSAAFTSVAGVYKLNATSLLSLFKQWLTTTKNLAAYDHAMFITATEIYGGVDNGIKFNITKGLAYVGSVCHGNGESSSIIEDRGAYQSEGVVAHELAHSFGSHHDGENNACSSPARYIMSDSSYPETNANIYNPWIFSACSSESILNYLKILEQNETLLQKCLVSASGSIEPEETHTVSANDQCKLFYGNESFVCRGQGLPSLDRICDEFYCRKPGTDMCERMTAATGTCCGYLKKCMRGLCVDAAQEECLIDSCPFGDQPGIIVDGKTCAQLDSTYCYSENINLKCCATCAKQRISKPGCSYGDKQLGCKASDCGSYFATGPYVGLPYSFVCCSTCPDTIPCSDVTSVSVQEGSKTVLYTCGEYILDQGNRFTCYQKTLLAGCCKSCEDVRNATSPECPWGDKQICTSLLSKPPGTTCTATQLLDCCYTCDLLKSRVPQTTTTTTTTKSTTTTTKSATTTTTAKTTKLSTTSTAKTSAKTTKLSAASTAKTATGATAVRPILGQVSTNRPQSSQPPCKATLQKRCSACMHVVGVQMLCVIILLNTHLVHWLSS